MTSRGKFWGGSGPPWNPPSSALARYIAISYKTDYPQIAQAGYLSAKQQIPMVFKKNAILSLFYLARVASIT